MSSIRVLVVDDHDLFRRGLTEVLSEEPDIEIVGEARDGREAIERAEAVSPDVMFMDLNMPGQGGIEATAYIAQRWPEIKVLILTVSEEPTDLFRCLEMGALGYVLKTASPSQIVDALRQVYQGWVVISPTMAPRMLSALAPSPTPSPVQFSQVSQIQLTPREEETLQLVGQGLSNADIADTLVLSENTIKTHIKNILGKLHVKNRSQAVAYAAQIGLLQTSESSEGPRES